MEYGLLLYCKLYHNLESFRKKYDIHAKEPVKFPAHITLSYLRKDLSSFEINDIIENLSKCKSFNLKFSNIIEKNDIIYLEPDLEQNSIIDKINDSISNYIIKYPKSGYHITLAYNHYAKINLSMTDRIKINKLKNDIVKQPLEVKFEKIWLVKRNKNKNKNKNKNWFRSKTINLK